MFLFFFVMGFLSRPFTNHKAAGKGSISLTPQYHFHTLYRHLGISQVITAESLPMQIASVRTRTENPWFSTNENKLNQKSVTDSIVLAKQAVADIIECYINRALHGTFTIWTYFFKRDGFDVAVYKTFLEVGFPKIKWFNKRFLQVLSPS